jgi:hypothetical protein
VKIRVSGFLDRGVLRFRIHKEGKCYGYLTLQGLCKWIENKKPAVQKNNKAGTQKVIRLPLSVPDLVPKAKGGE